MKLRHVTLHQLRLFQSLGTHLNYTRVAEELFLTQPAVSIQIKRLEESVGMPLVEQMGKRIYLTEAGKELFEACRDVMERLRVLNEDMTGMEQGVKGPISLAAITTAKFFIPHLLGVFLKKYPEVEPHITFTNQARVVERLQHNMDDVVIMGTLPENMDLEAQYFLDNPIVVVAHPSHPLVGKKKIPLARIAEEKFIAREPGSGTRAARTKLFAEHGLKASVYMELGSSEAIKQAVMADLGISVLSRHSVRLELDSGTLALLDVEHFPLMRKWYAVNLKGKKLSNTARMFLDFLLNDGAQILEKAQPQMQTKIATAAKKTQKTKIAKTTAKSSK